MAAMAGSSGAGPAPPGELWQAEPIEAAEPALDHG
jgi:hypothetical protein